MADAVQGLTQRIVALLDAGDLETEDTFEIVEFADSPYYLQFANHAAGEVVVELVSDEFLPEDARLGKDARAGMDALGWHAPSKGLSPNWFRWVSARGTGGRVGCGRCIGRRVRPDSRGRRPVAR